MPIRTTCPHSGAIIFVPTPEEKQLRENNEKVEELVTTLQAELQEANALKIELQNLIKDLKGE